jgi:hypothetical protein
MKASRFFLSCAFFLVASAPAHAHGGGLLVLVAFASAPILILIFLPLCALSGMEGRRWIAFGLYLAALVVAFALQWQEWYHPFARMFPEPVWLQQRLPEFMLIPPLDLLMWLVLAVIVIYLALRDGSVPIRVMLPPAGNLLWGSLFSIAAVALWTYVLFDPGVKMWTLTWSEGIRMPLLLAWIFIVPVVLTFVAIHLFRNGPRFGRHRARR